MRVARAALVDAQVGRLHVAYDEHGADERRHVVDKRGAALTNRHVLVVVVVLALVVAHVAAVADQ